jgi:hypothetical protein
MRDEHQTQAQAVDRRLEMAELAKLPLEERLRRIVDEEVSDLEAAVPQLKCITHVRESMLQRMFEACRLPDVRRNEKVA